MHGVCSVCCRRWDTLVLHIHPRSLSKYVANCKSRAACMLESGSAISRSARMFLVLLQLPCVENPTSLHNWSNTSTHTPWQSTQSNQALHNPLHAFWTISNSVMWCTWWDYAGALCNWPQLKTKFENVFKWCLACWCFVDWVSHTIIQLSTVLRTSCWCLLCFKQLWILWKWTNSFTIQLSILTANPGAVWWTRELPSRVMVNSAEVASWTAPLYASGTDGRMCTPLNITWSPTYLHNMKVQLLCMCRCQI